MTPAQSRLLLALLAFGYLWLFPFSEPIHNPNEMVRVYAARAIAEHGTYAIGRRDVDAAGNASDSGPILEQWGGVNDKALACDDPKAERPHCSGWLYACKAPGINQLGAPFLWVLNKAFAKLAGHPPSKAWIVWWLRLWIVILPTIAGFWWLGRQLASRLQRPGVGIAVTLAAAFGSLALTYGQMFAGHQPAGMALLLAYAGISATTPQAAARKNLFLAGLGVGLATLIEFTAAPAGMVLLAWLLLRRKQWRDWPWVVLGGLGPALLLAHFDWKAFGAPWRLPYGYVENAGFVQDMAPGFFGIHLPTWEKTAGSLFSPFTGLYFFAPWCALAWLGIIGARSRMAEPGRGFWQDRRGEALAVWLVCGYFLFFQCTHSLWRGGWVVGPRYITAIVPFAAIAVAHALDGLQGRSARLGDLVLAISAGAAVVVTGACTAVSQGFPFEVHNPLPEVVGPLLLRGWVWPSLPLLAGAPAMVAALPWFLALLAAITWICVALEPPALRARGFWVRASGSLFVLALVAAASFGLWSVPGKRDGDDRAGTVRFLMRSWPMQPLKGAKMLAADERL